jgi:hypothetical protein
MMITITFTHCISAIYPQAMMIQHKDHDYTEAASLIAPSRSLLAEARDECTDLSARAETVSTSVQRVMADLNSDTDECALEIENSFSVLRKALASREKALLSRLKSIADRKKHALSEQLARLHALAGCCLELVDCADALLEAGCRPEDRNGGLYMVNSAHAVRRRASELSKKFTGLPQQPAAEPDIRDSTGTGD